MPLASPSAPTRSDGAPAPLERLLLGAATIVGVLVVWHVAVIASHTKVFPSPLAVARALGQLWLRGDLLRFLRDSLLRVGAGFGLATVVAVPLGLAMGMSAPLAEALDPLVQIFRPISPIAWIPISIGLFGITNAACVLLIFLAAFFPVVTSTVDAVRGIPRILPLAAENFGLGRGAILARVIFPAALPKILAGLRIGLGVAWLVVVAAEMIAVDSGLGYLIIDARNAGQRYDLVVAGMVLIGVVGLLLDLGIRRLGRLRSLGWSESQR